MRAVHRRIDDLAAHAVSRPAAPLRFRFPALPSLPGTTLVRADEVAVDGRLTPPVSVALDPGDRLVVTGPNGAGTSTLLSVLTGALRPDHGVVTRAPEARLGVVPQEARSEEERSVHQVYEATVQRLRADRGDVQPVPLGSLGLFTNADLRRPVAALSMGQQRRLDLVLALVVRPHLLLLDEPTNHLSMALVDELTEAFETTEAAVVVVTHDRQLREDLAHWPSLPLDGAAWST